jgi:FdhE protein
METSKLQEAGASKWRELLESAVPVDNGLEAATDDFFARACLQPVAENLQAQVQTSTDSIQSTCPACGGSPQTAILRPEGEGASRWLQCSFCLREWPFRRLACPWCREENRDKLPRYSAEQCSYVHVEACDSCKRYLKAVDLTVDGHAIPVVDEAALAVLDVWAVDTGYTKIVRNILGF